jgi:hypothetical protein
MFSLSPDNREIAITILVDNDYDSIINGDALELLNSYLEFGHRGYRDYTDIELVRELQERELFDWLTMENV